MTSPPKKTNKSRQAERIPQFFKIFDATKYSNQLHIPSAYTSYMQGNLPNKAFLSDKFGNMWPVKLAQIESEWYFGEGWAKVAQDNSLEHRDFVVFQFDGDKIFYFQIIGNDSCDKGGVGSLKFTWESKDMETDEVKGAEIVQESELSGGGSGGQQEAATKAERKQKAKIDLYGADIFKSGFLVQPKNPYFVTQIMPTRRHKLYIPSDVIRDFKLTLPERIILRDPAWRTWPSHLTTWIDGRPFYTGGWEGLCRMNLIDPEDKCICEFLQGEGEPVLQILIVRSQNAP